MKKSGLIIISIIVLILAIFAITTQLLIPAAVKHVYIRSISYDVQENFDEYLSYVQREENQTTTQSYIKVADLKSTKCDDYVCIYAVPAYKNKSIFSVEIKNPVSQEDESGQIVFRESQFMSTYLSRFEQKFADDGFSFLVARNGMNDEEIAEKVIANMKVKCTVKVGPIKTIPITVKLNNFTFLKNYDEFDKERESFNTYSWN